MHEFSYRISDSLGEILKGIRCYFDKALPDMLLYKKECQQYEEAVVGNISPSTVYGAEHLLRLFGSVFSIDFLQFHTYNFHHLKQKIFSLQEKYILCSHLLNMTFNFTFKGFFYQLKLHDSF